ncbi:AbrB/MazE/SpoVT family DNA-binding domain-containing protein [Burkholderia ambifaria]|uniref:type II toxin-antitoxin system VapB family antitoxin n=1 Tax=Burkholderia TaxID=32008 RepID=UPI000CFE9D6F|nr:type II toxin-antitoxin system VapB family antitoxin [Burkholderia ambifaria]ELK6210854.1 AbrB/MazE/SpoVT family DNA-binding domain-containing protein [Burkholderia ambifaria]PRF96811.1 AbrB family transcriptional regulator [Burkholderia ambifaria]
MRTVSIFKNARNQAIRIPKDMEFEGVTELEIRREGDTLLLRPVRPTWLSFATEPRADADFLVERPTVVELGRFDLPGADDDAPTESNR